MGNRLISDSTLSYFRSGFFFIGLLSAAFYIQKESLVLDLWQPLLEMPNGLTIIYLPLLLLLLTSIILGSINLAKDLTKDTKAENFFIFFVTFILILLFLPFYSFYRLVIRPVLGQEYDERKFQLQPLMFGLLIGSVIFTLTSFIYFQHFWVRSIDQSRIVVGQRLGILPEPIPIAGTGSMYPTFPKGEAEDPIQQAQELVATAGMLPYPDGFSLFGYRLFGGYKIKHGDIVAFANEKTSEITEKKYGQEAGLVKRVIGLEGDKIELRGGILYVNGVAQKEPYVAKARSTFGGDFVAECNLVEVPKDHLFVLGDNRTASNDSRHEVGFIKLSEVDHVLPYEKQLGVVDSLWHNPENDLLASAKISVDRGKILTLINEQRIKRGVPKLGYNAKLNTSAKLRGEKMLEFNDFSAQAEKSNYGLTKALTDAGYENVLYGEFYVQGYFEAEELVENWIEFPKTLDFLAKKEYEEIGFSEVEGEVNGCPTQVIVFHLGGYVPPDYSEEEINSVRKSKETLEGIKPGWEKLKDSGEFYNQNKADADRLNELINNSINSLDQVIKQMERNQWLTQSQKTFLENQSEIYEEIDQLTKKLNDRIRDASS